MDTSHGFIRQPYIVHMQEYVWNAIIMTILEHNFNILCLFLLLGYIFFTQVLQPLCILQGKENSDVQEVCAISYSSKFTLPCSLPPEYPCESLTL